MSRHGLVGLGAALGLVGALVGIWAKYAYDKAEVAGYFAAGVGGSSPAEADMAGVVAGMQAALLPGSVAALLIVAAAAVLIVAAVRRPEPVAAKVAQPSS